MRIIYIYSTSCLVLLLPLLSQAQWSLGWEGGYTSHHTPLGVSNSPYTSNTGKGGWGWGLGVQYTGKQRVGFLGGLQLMKKNYALRRTGPYSGVYENRTNTYLQLPLFLRVQVYEYKQIRLSVIMGSYAGYWLRSKRKGAIPDLFNSAAEVDSHGQLIQNLTLFHYSENYHFKATDHRLEWGGLAAVAIESPITKKYSIQLLGDYYRSLTDQQKAQWGYLPPPRNRTIYVSAAILWQLSQNPQKEKRS